MTELCAVVNSEARMKLCPPQFGQAGSSSAASSEIG
jgi:hypothetical protein